MTVSGEPPPGLEEYLEGGEHYDALVGFRYLDIDGDHARGRLEIRPHHHQPHGIVHGGVYTGIVESLASVAAAAWAGRELEDVAVVGVSNATDFFRPVRGGTVVGVAEPVHRGRTQQVWQVTITREDDGALVARGQVRLQNVPADRLR